MKKTAYFGLSILDLSKTATYEFWYDYVKPKYGEKLCYRDTGSFIAYVKQMALTKILQKMLEKDLTLPILKQIDHRKKQKSDWVNER